MSVIGWFKRTPSGRYWSFVGVLVGIFIGGFAILQGFLFTNPSVEIAVINKIDVLDVKSELSDLEIFFENQNIREKNLNLRIYRTRVTNSGWTDILQNHFDPIDLWGIEIENGRIIRISATRSENDYILNRIKASKIGENFIRFSPFIFDSGAKFEIDILVLHNKNVEPNLIAVGKIAGITKLKIIDEYKKDEVENLLINVFSGDLVTQTIRTPSYFFIFLVFAILFGASVYLIFIVIRKIFVEFPRRRRFNAYQSKLKQLNKKQIETLKDMYVRNGRSGVESTLNYLQDEKRLEKLVRAYAEAEQRKNELLQKPVDTASEDSTVDDLRDATSSAILPIYPIPIDHLFGFGYSLQKLIDAGAIESGDKISVDANFVAESRKFIDEI